MSGLVLDPADFMEGLSTIQPGDIGKIKGALDVAQVAHFGEWAIQSDILRPTDINGLTFGNGLSREAEHSPYSEYRAKTKTPDEMLEFAAELTPFIPAKGSISALRARDYTRRLLPTASHSDKKTEDYRLIVPIQKKGTLVHVQPSAGHWRIKKTHHQLEIGDVGIINNLCPPAERALHHTRTWSGVVWLVIGKFAAGAKAVQHY